ncbi:hypothetical protein DL990_06590 [Amycolatopsis sp. WAC 01416]|uniref:hypothetical protein n=1 Tax=Amycolatopsis sp. WAC 01416 TaxID=2203196 RepID=UPI000F7AD4A1|nr:hypothetical protein [Amycolatopsis sp. WAC 01416]RSN35832.1 hypothetical protein DL990_06590 [Amycolatopsis sp. WAC 01416]
MRSLLRSPAVRAMAGRLSWGLGDQAVSSITNFVVGLFVARSLGTFAFGMFSLAWVSYGVVLNLSRGLTTDPLMVRFSGVSTESWRAATAKATGTALSAGVVAGAISVVAGLVVSGPIGGAFIALGVVIPTLLLQDAWRFTFFAAGHGKKAFVNDVVWGIALIPALFIAHQWFDTVVAFILAWGLSGAVAAGYGCLQSGVRPDPRGTLEWLKRHRDLGARYVVENVSNAGSTQLRMYGLGAIAGLASVGAVRGAELLLGPFFALLMGLSLVTVAESARVLQRAPHRLRRFCAVLGAGQAVAALIWGLALLLVPDDAGRFVLGDVWDPASELILPVTIGIAAAGFNTGAAAGLRALGAAKRSLRAQLINSAGYVGLGLIGAFLAGASGSAWGVALAITSGSAVWWLQLHTALKEHLTSEKEEMRTS